MRPENEWFQPERLRPLYAAYVAIAGVFALLPVLLLALTAPRPVAVGAAAVWILVFGFLAWWVGAFAETAAYRLTDEDVEYRRGVWFRKVSEVPYDRITNVDTKQGPVQRFVGVGALSLHTAGYAAQTGAELTVTGIEDYEEVKEQILAKVRERPPVATESGEGRGRPAGGEATAATATAGDADLLAEVRAIRELLEADRSG